MGDTAFMQLALAQALAAAAAGEVPVGAVVVRNGEVIATGRNAPIQSKDPTAHAEIQALRAAALVLGNYRLDGCELFVTLEPCAMCSGAMLHARLARVVYGAADPKTGAAGSIVDLFAQPQLNHHTQVQGDILAADCAAVLHGFFQGKRTAQSIERRARHPLRDDALRTPDSRFSELPGYPWQPRYMSRLASLAGLRMHYLDEGPVDAAQTYLCLHDDTNWSYLYRDMIPVLQRAGCRVVVPDLIGFGKSDKPKKEASHLFSFHRQSLLELINELELRNVILVVQRRWGYLALSLPMAEPTRFIGLLVLDATLELECCEAFSAPFPNNGYRAATRSTPSMVSNQIKADGATLSRKMSEFWREQWQGELLMVRDKQSYFSGHNARNCVLEIIAGCSEDQHSDRVGGVDSVSGQHVAQAALAHFNQNGV